MYKGNNEEGLSLAKAVRNSQRSERAGEIRAAANSLSLTNLELSEAYDFRNTSITES